MNEQRLLVGVVALTAFVGCAPTVSISECDAGSYTLVLPDASTREGGASQADCDRYCFKGAGCTADTVDGGGATVTCQEACF